MINYKPEVYKKVNIGTNLNVEHAKRHPLLYYKCIRRVKKLWHFNKKYNETCCVKAGTDIDDLNLDYIVFGSDAIFNVEHVLFRDIYMGVGIEKTKKISYAPSCEDLNPNYRLNEQCIESLKQFKSISVRDEHTQELILKNVNRKAIRVLDPTLLYDFTRMMTTSDYGLAATFSSWYSIFLIICTANLSYSHSRGKIDFQNNFVKYVGATHTLAVKHMLVLLHHNSLQNTMLIYQLSLYFSSSFLFI